MTKKILLLLTGGTICSQITGSVKKQGTTTQTVLEDSFFHSSSPFAHCVKFTATKNYGIFSENMTVTKWNCLLESLRQLPGIRDTAVRHGHYPSLRNIPVLSDENSFDGIIIAHGTDTLAYSAALFSILLRDMGVPVFLVSSNEALEATNANGKDNFRAAADCICSGIRPNVYVTYQNPSDGKMYLHLASRLTQCQNYSEDFFSSGMTDITDIAPQNADMFFSRLPGYSEPAMSAPVVDWFSGIKLTDAVLRIEPYTGLNYKFFDLDGVRAVLHGTYHSGTVCSEPAPEEYDYSVRSLLDRCAHIPVYIAPADVSGIVYETVLDIQSTTGNVYFINGFTSEMLYVKLLVACSLFTKTNEINTFLNSEYNHERIR